MRQFHLFNDVLSGNVAPIRKPSSFKLGISDPDGDYDISFTDNPWNSAIMALKQDCSKDRSKFESSMTRMWALANVISSPPKRLAKLVQIERSGVQVHEALIEAAGTARIKRDGSFDIMDLARCAKELD